MNRSHFSRIASALMLTMLVSMWIAPSAHAQLAGATDAVGSSLGGGGLSAPDTSGVTDSLEGGSNSSGTDSDSTADGGGTDLVGGVAGSIQKTVEQSKETVTEVTEATNDTLGSVGSGTLEGVTGAVEGTVGNVGKELGSKDPRKERTAQGAARTTTTSNSAQVLGHSFADALRSDGKALKPVLARSNPTSTVSAPVGESLVEQISKIAAEAVKQAAFPIALILLVVGFLMVQNRVDRKDPKLALAPVDSQHDSLSFT